MSASNEILVTVRVPVSVPEPQRAQFEGAAVSFLLGHDRIRPEITRLLEKQGVDLRQLARLSAPEPMGVCPSPGALEIVPDDALAALCRERGVSLVDGGRVRFAFDYGAATGSGVNELELSLRLPEALGDITPPQLGSVVRALFGDCALAPRAQDYLRTFGLDVVRFAEAHKEAIGLDRPVTSRVSPEVEAMLKTFGLETEGYGQLRVASSTVLEANENPPLWSKTTCC